MRKQDSIRIEGYVDEMETIIYKDKETAKMCYEEDERRDCAKVKCETTNGNDLARKYAELDLSDSDRLFRKHGIVSLDGTLTQKGKDFLINVLFEDYRDNVEEALLAIEEAEEPRNEED